MDGNASDAGLTIGQLIQIIGVDCPDFRKNLLRFWPGATLETVVNLEELRQASELYLHWAATADLNRKSQFSP